MDKNIVVLGTSFNPSFFRDKQEKFIVTWEEINPNKYFSFKQVDDINVVINDFLPRKSFFKLMDRLFPQTFIYNTDVEKFIKNWYTWNEGDDIIMFKPNIKIKDYNLEDAIKNENNFSFYKMNVIIDPEYIKMFT